MAEMDGAAGKEAWPNVAQGQVRVHRTFLVFTSDAAKPVVASGVVVGFDRRYAGRLYSFSPPTPTETPSGGFAF